MCECVMNMMATMHPNSDPSVCPHLSHSVRAVHPLVLSPAATHYGTADTHAHAQELELAHQEVGMLRGQLDDAEGLQAAAAEELHTCHVRLHAFEEGTASAAEVATGGSLPPAQGGNLDQLEVADAQVASLQDDQDAHGPADLAKDGEHDEVLHSSAASHADAAPSPEAESSRIARPQALSVQLRVSELERAASAAGSSTSTPHPAAVGTSSHAAPFGGALASSDAAAGDAPADAAAPGAECAKSVDLVAQLDAATRALEERNAALKAAHTELHVAQHGLAKARADAAHHAREADRLTSELSDAEAMREQLAQLKDELRGSMAEVQQLQGEHAVLVEERGAAEAAAAAAVKKGTGELQQALRNVQAQMKVCAPLAACNELSQEHDQYTEHQF